MSPVCILQLKDLSFVVSSELCPQFAHFSSFSEDRKLENTFDESCVLPGLLNFHARLLT